MPQPTYAELLALTDRLARKVIDTTGSGRSDDALLRIRRAMPADVPGTPADVATAVRASLSFVRHVDIRGGRRHAGTPEDVIVHKCLLAALAGLTGDWSHVPPPERRVLSDALDRAGIRMPDLPPAVTPPEPGSAYAYAFAWPAAAGRNGIMLSRGTATFRHVPAVDAPICCTLATPEGAIAVRMFGGRHVRPVLAPGFWAPADVRTFAHAASGGVSWQDNPFDPLVDRMSGTPAMALYARQVDGALTEADGRWERERASAMAEVAGGLVVVDGIVHRPCPEPTAVMVMRGRRMVVTWALGDLHGDMRMDTVAGDSGIDRASGGTMWGAFDRDVWLAVPAQEAKALLWVYQACRGSSPWGVRSEPRPPDPARDVDTGHMPARPSAMARALATMLDRDHVTAGYGPATKAAGLCRAVADAMDDGHPVEAADLDGIATALTDASRHKGGPKSVAIRMAGVRVGKDAQAYAKSLEETGLSTFSP